MLQLAPSLVCALALQGHPRLASARARYSPPRAAATPETTASVFMDVAIGGEPAGRLTFNLYGNVAPKTCDNFRALCTGEKGVGVSGKPLHFKNSIFHRIIPQFMCQGGDFTDGRGTGGESIYGTRFEDESFALAHTAPGMLSMANSGPNSNGSQFFITTAPAPWLDGKHVVFGRVIDGMLTVRKMEAVPVGANSKPTLPVLITECGEM